MAASLLAGHMYAQLLTLEEAGRRNHLNADREMTEAAGAVQQSVHPEFDLPQCQHQAATVNGLPTRRQARCTLCI